MITQSINLNLVPGGVLPRINVSQYDKGTRTLEFTLYNGSVLFSIPDDVTITIQGTKADSTGFQYECTFEDSVVTSDLSEQMTVFAGEVVCELVLTQGTNILGTANFILNVEAAALSDDTVISDTDLPLLQEAIEAAAEAAASAEEAANNASAAEESSEDSEAYAIGTRGGTDVTSDDPAYHNNAKYYAESVAEAIENLDVSDTAVAGAYVTAVSETDGVISVTREAADTTPISGSKKMVTSGGVYTELDELSSEISNLNNSTYSVEYAIGNIFTLKNAYSDQLHIWCSIIDEITDSNGVALSSLLAIGSYGAVSIIRHNKWDIQILISGSDGFASAFTNYQASSIRFIVVTTGGTSLVTVS